MGTSNLRDALALPFLLLVLAVGCVGRPTEAPEELPWADDFSSAQSWQTESDAAAEVAVEGGVLRIYVAVPNQLAWASARKDLSDFHLTVEATQVAGPDDNEYGVLARIQDAGNFYRFSISGDGYFLVSKFVNGRQELIGGNWTPSEAIRRGRATNVLEVTCRGESLRFSVNGHSLVELTDGQFSHGDIGFYAGTFYEGGVEIHFDNLWIGPP